MSSKYNTILDTFPLNDGVKYVSSRPKGEKSNLLASLQALSFPVLWIIVLLTLFGPPLLTGRNIRIDTLIIYPLFAFFIIFLRVKIPKGFGLVAFAFLLQALLLGAITPLYYIFNSVAVNHSVWLAPLAYLRVFFILLLALAAIRNEKHALIIIKLMLFGVIIHGFIGLLTFFHFSPVESVIGLIYKNHNYKPGMRAFGAFQTVHGLAYFSLYFSFVAFSMWNILPKKFIIISIVASICGIILPLSRGAYLSFAAGCAIYFFMAYSLSREIRIIIILVIIFLTALPFCSLIPERLNEKIINNNAELYEASSRIISGKGVESLKDSKRKMGFISSRLNHGWAHGLKAWREHPVIGVGDTKSFGFVGDGGYIVMLAKNGLIGLFLHLFLIVSVISVFMLKMSGKNRYSRQIKYCVIAITTSILVANLATSAIRERFFELFPVLLVALYLLGRSYGKITDNPDENFVKKDLK